MTKKPMKPPAKKALRPRSMPGVKAHNGATRAPRAGKAAGVPKLAAGAKSPLVTQGDKLVKLLRRKGGASMLEISDALGIQTHSARALISTESRKRRLDVVLADWRYRIV